jgi:hypothetical protein
MDEYSTAENERLILESGCPDPAKLIRILLESADDPRLELALPRLRAESPHERTTAIDLLGELFTISVEYVDENVIDCVSIAVALVDGDDLTLLAPIVRFLARAASNRADVVSRLLRLLQFVTGAVALPEKVFAEVARNAVEFVATDDV